MATNFPTNLDNFTNPSSTDSLSSPDHATQHADVNDAVEALQAKVGVNNSAVTTSLDYRVRNPSLVGGAARPLLTIGAYLDGSTGVLFPGGVTTSNIVTSPDSAALSITGDIDIKVKIKLDDWTPPTNNRAILGNTDNVGANGGYQFGVTTTGTLYLVTTPDGTTANQILTNSTTATGFTDGATKWVRATRDVDNGASGNSTKFYTSDDGTTWTQLGTTVTVAGTTSIFNGSLALGIGARGASSGSQVPAGTTIGRVIIQSAYDTANNTTSVAFDANFETATADALAFTESSTNAATVTINTTRYTYGIPNRVSTSSVTAIDASDRTSFTTFRISTPITIDMARFEVTTGPSSSSTMKMAIYSADNNYQPTGSPVVDFGSVTVGSSATGVFSKQITGVTLQPGAYLIAWNMSVAFTMRWLRPSAEFAVGFGANYAFDYPRVAQSNSSFPSSSPIWDFIAPASGIGLAPIILRWRAA